MYLDPNTVWNIPSDAAGWFYRKRQCTVRFLRENLSNDSAPLALAAKGG
jgi:hypothetical protein